MAPPPIDFDAGVVDRRDTTAALTSEQLQRSRRLNSEGLEGLIPRAEELVKTGFYGGFVAFLPWMVAVIVAVVGTSMYFGDKFVHRGSADISYNRVDPYDLLNEPTYDPIVPLKTPEEQQRLQQPDGLGQAPNIQIQGAGDFYY